MSRVYLAGGINALSDSEANDWRTEAKDLLGRVGIGWLDPMARDYRGQEDANVRAIVKGDLADIEKCTAVLAFCPRPSWGTAMEIHHVATQGRYVRFGTAILSMRQTVAVVPTGPVSPWLRHHADAITETIEAAVAQLAEWLN